MEVIMTKTIAEETKKKLQVDYPLSRTAKSRIRKDGVLKLIRSQPAGYLFNSVELIEAAGFNTKKNKEYKNGWSFVNYLVKSTYIYKIPEIGTKKCSYSINEDSKVVKRTMKKGQKNTPIERSIDELVPKKDEVDVKKINTDLHMDSVNLDNRVYNITFTIDKKSDTEYGKKAIAKLELNETTLYIAGEMIRQTIEASK